jgi:hypothetical protein
VSHNRRVVTIAAAVRVYGDPIMRATVGPLPSAVYWRRRAVVLGAVLLGIIVLFVSCSGDDKNDQRGQGGGSSQFPTPGPATSASADPSPSFIDNPGNGPALPPPSNGDAGDGDGDGATDPPVASGLPTLGSGQGTGDGQNTNVTAPTGSSCADTEILVTPTTAAQTVKRGANVQIGMKIKNIGSRTCTRDVGADPQELYLDGGGRKYWSSDTCSTDKSSNVRELKPGEELVFTRSWNGRQSNTCAGNLAAGPNPPPGQFQLRGRLGTLLSNPVGLTIVA